MKHGKNIAYFQTLACNFFCSGVHSHCFISDHGKLATQTQEEHRGWNSNFYQRHLREKHFVLLNTGGNFQFIQITRD